MRWAEGSTGGSEPPQPQRHPQGRRAAQPEPRGAQSTHQTPSPAEKGVLNLPSTDPTAQHQGRKDAQNHRNHKSSLEKISKWIRTLQLGSSAWQLAGHRVGTADHESRPCHNLLSPRQVAIKGSGGHYKTQNHLEGLQGHQDRIQRAPSPAWGGFTETQGHQGRTWSPQRNPERPRATMEKSRVTMVGPETPRATMKGSRTTTRDILRNHRASSGLQDHHKGGSWASTGGSWPSR